jgi:nitrate/nitrite transporter NarK
MRPTTQSYFLVAVPSCAVSIVRLIFTLLFQRPTQFDGSGNPNVTVGEVFSHGTVTSLLLFPWIALAVLALLTLSRRWRVTLVVLVLCFLGWLFVLGGLGEAFAPSTLYVPRAVLLAAGVVYVLLGLSRLLSRIADVMGRARAARRPSPVM